MGCSIVIRFLILHYIVQVQYSGAIVACMIRSYTYIYIYICMDLCQGWQGRLVFLWFPGQVWSWGPWKRGGVLWALSPGVHYGLPSKKFSKSRFVRGKTSISHEGASFNRYFGASLGIGVGIIWIGVVEWNTVIFMFSKKDCNVVLI